MHPTMIFQVIKVNGQSLYPAYRDGDFVAVSKIPILFTGIHPGDVVIFQHPTHGKLIKKVERLESGGKALWVVGTNPNSIDSRQFGAVPVQFVLGKVIWHFSKP